MLPGRAAKRSTTSHSSRPPRRAESSSPAGSLSGPHAYTRASSAGSRRQISSRSYRPRSELAQTYTLDPYRAARSATYAMPSRCRPGRAVPWRPQALDLLDHGQQGRVSRPTLGDHRRPVTTVWAPVRPLSGSSGVPIHRRWRLRRLGKQRRRLDRHRAARRGAAQPGGLTREGRPWERIASYPPRGASCSVPAQAETRCRPGRPSPRRRTGRKDASRRARPVVPPRWTGHR